MTFLERCIQALENNKIIAGVIIVFIIVTGISTFAKWVTDLIPLLMCSWSNRLFYCDANGLSAIKYNTGWIYLGLVDNQETTYRTQPLYSIEKSTYTDSNLTPRVGEIIKLSAKRDIVILDYKSTGVNSRFTPPWKANVLDENDYTGYFMPKGSVVEVRDISIAGYPGHDKVVWARIGLPPE